ncbi:hypothetical protein B0H14DRAFT_3713286 [Mycena olivaceomarginata]|nr:hypothetical protein B0H14DRAFT_3713286 [Mycena olivaceomarginata]
MAPSPLEALKQGYEKLKKQVGRRKKALEDRLANKERIPDDDGEWLDNEANLVDEQRKAAGARMKELAGGVKASVAVSMPTTKRKRPEEKAVVPEGKQPGKKKAVLPVFTKKENATLQRRIEILDWLHQNGKKPPLISAWVKEESKWRTEYQSHVGAAAKVKRIWQTQHPEVSEMLDLWAEQAMACDVMLTGEVLRQKWTQFADLVGVPEDERLNLSDGWLQMGEINGGDDDVEDNMGFQPCPTRREALSATQTLRKYTETLDDGFARKLEQLLASFGRQTQLEETNAPCNERLRKAACGLRNAACGLALVCIQAPPELFISPTGLPQQSLKKAAWKDLARHAAFVQPL